jgi:hypothetical protein
VRQIYKLQDLVIAGESEIDVCRMPLPCETSTGDDEIYTWARLSVREEENGAGN